MILSIMDQGKVTFVSSESHSRKASETKPAFFQACAAANTPSRSFFPFWEQLSMLTMAMGCPPAWKRRYSSAAAMDMVCRGASGPAAKSCSATGRVLPDRSVRA